MITLCRMAGGIFVIMRFVILTEQFYNDYAGCSEILMKPGRPYVCMAAYIDGKLFAVPIRHHISHKYCFRTVGESGLDYTKAVVIEKQDYIARKQATISREEYNIIKGKEKLIENGIRKYVSLYKKALRYQSKPEYKRIVSCSALQYFIK